MIIYKVINKVNNKVYIGQTIDTLIARKNNHKTRSKSNSKLYFHTAIRKYGFENFEWEEIDKADSLEELDYLEKYWIKWFRSNNRAYGYNLAEGGRVNRGNKRTEEQLKMMSETSKKTWESNERRRKHSEIIKNTYKNGRIHGMKGKKWDEKVKEKMSKAQRGKHSSPKTEFKKGGIPWNKKKVLCIEFGKIYESVKLAAYNTGLDSRLIAAVCRGERKTHGCLHWKYIE